MHGKAKPEVLFKDGSATEPIRNETYSILLEWVFFVIGGRKQMITQTGKRVSLKKSQKGTSFVELMIAVFVLSFVVVGIIGLFAKCNVFANQIKDFSIVSNALNEQMETIRSMDYDDILAMASTMDSEGLGELKNGSGTITLTDSYSDADIRKVTLTVNWTTIDGASRSEQMVGVVTREGINKQ